MGLLAAVLGAMCGEGTRERDARLDIVDTHLGCGGMKRSGKSSAAAVVDDEFTRSGSWYWRWRLEACSDTN